MRRLTSADYIRMPWRNGGGATTQIVVAPDDGAQGNPTAARFLYRVSIADVETDGPFSRFEGYDRHIMMLSGRGMTLDCGAHGVVDLTEPLVPRRFSGDWDVRGTLVDGAVRDFNLIVDRARATSSLEVHQIAAPVAMTFDADAVCVVYVITGALANCAEGETLVADAPFEIAPRGSARLAVAMVRFTAR
jgi:environmental stress-induced protein Ves